MPGPIPIPIVPSLDELEDEIQRVASRHEVTVTNHRVLLLLALDNYGPRCLMVDGEVIYEGNGLGAVPEEAFLKAMKLLDPTATIAYQRTDPAGHWSLRNTEARMKGSTP